VSFFLRSDSETVKKSASISVHKLHGISNPVPKTTAIKGKSESRLII
jgi:hypothetical protein